MIEAKTTPTSPRLALRPEEAAEAIGVSRTFFDDYVRDELRWIRRGRLRLVAVAELERWLDRNGALTIEADRR